MAIVKWHPGKIALIWLLTLATCSRSAHDSSAEGLASLAVIISTAVTWRWFSSRERSSASASTASGLAGTHSLAILNRITEPLLVALKQNSRKEIAAAEKRLSGSLTRHYPEVCYLVTFCTDVAARFSTLGDPALRSELGHRVLVYLWTQLRVEKALTDPDYQNAAAEYLAVLQSGRGFDHFAIAGVFARRLGMGFDPNDMGERLAIETYLTAVQHLGTPSSS